jgi:hypothetical protein
MLPKTLSGILGIPFSILENHIKRMARPVVGSNKFAVFQP